MANELRRDGEVVMTLPDGHKPIKTWTSPLVFNGEVFMHSWCETSEGIVIVSVMRL